MEAIITLIQLLMAWINERRYQKDKKEQYTVENFQRWLAEKDHEEVLGYLEGNKEELEKTNILLKEIREKFDDFNKDNKKIQNLLESIFKVAFPSRTSIWERPRINAPFERWHYIKLEEGGEIEHFDAKWKLRVPYQKILSSDVFHVTIRQSVDRMDPEGPFCKECAIEMIEDIKENGIYWICEGCEKSFKSDLLIEEARAKVYRINKPKILKQWLEKYGDK